MLLPMAFGVTGLLLGFLADRLAARWPRHADGRIRPVDWRTLVVSGAGALALGALPVRWSEPRDLAILALAFVALIILLATDLDQKLLPDLVTFPLAAFSLLVLILGWNPLVNGRELGVASALAAALIAPAFLFATNLLLRGGLGMGDLKLAVGLGLIAGLTRLVGGFFLASAFSAVVLVLLLVSQRIGRKSAIPFGPILIAAGIFAAFLN